MAFFGAAAAAFAAFLAIFALKIKRGNLKNAIVTQDKLLEHDAWYENTTWLCPCGPLGAYVSEDHTRAFEGIPKEDPNHNPRLPPTPEPG